MFFFFSKTGPRESFCRSRGCTTPLDFAGELDGTSDVPAVQVELRVEVLLGRDGRGVVGAGALGHVTLTETQREA